MIAYFFIWPILQTKKTSLLFGTFKSKKKCWWNFSVCYKTSRINILHIYINILYFFPGFGVQKSIVQRTARETIWTRTNYFGEKLWKRVAIDDWPAEKASGKGRRTATCWLEGNLKKTFFISWYFLTLIINLPQLDDIWDNSFITWALVGGRGGG